MARRHGSAGSGNPGVNTLTIVATDPAGNASAPSNAIPIDVGPGNVC